MRKYQADIYIYILNVLNFCGKVKKYEIQKLFHIATIPTKPVQNLLDVTVDAGSVPVVY